jgi:hypothetical protein
MSLPRQVWVRAALVASLALFLSIIYSFISTAAQPRPVSPDLTPTVRPSALGAALVTRHDFPSLSYGVHTFLWWNQTLRERDLEWVRQLRFEYVKQIFDWNDMRSEREIYNWQYADAIVDEVEYRGLKLIVRLAKAPHWAESSDPNQPPFDLNAFGDYCQSVASRYKGRIAGYQVWNEPNLDREWGNRSPDPAGYVKLLATCYKAIKGVDPNAVVITAGLAPTGNDDTHAIPDERYLSEMYQAGLAAHYDVLGLNAPGYKSPPETAPDDPSLNGNRWQAFRHVEDMRAIMVANGEGAKQIALLEVGWTTDLRDTITVNGTETPNPYRWHAVTEKEQAQYLVGAYRYAGQHWQPWIGLIVTLYLPDPAWTANDEQYWWSIAESGYQGRLKPAYIDLANMERYVNGTVIPAIDPGDNPYKPMPPRSPTPTP